MEEKIRIGQIVNTLGLMGEVKVYPFTDYKERFEELEYVYIEDNIDSKLEIEKVRYKKQLIILKFKGMDSINAVKNLKNKYIAIDKKDIRELPEDSYYIFDLIGSKVLDENNTLIGKLIDVMQNTSQDIYVVEHVESKKPVLIPAVKEFIKDVNIEEKTIEVKLIEGMIE
ncbi:ribosome maturation factor RimM [Paramaledivibacter caminithermalis]|uniref:Ribosome maturation factor RimM n=1 Tax=Paramaledivibacter caminithermalis (strain DSM 15212 / CIP 107654 / DViRD3) TaxID=1121301 RepID=A0A1M6NJM4_PARC5|nr:ribosome maturation factor RimM [Paramaledivibacter caminithermalis]SHJ95958.1 16S rRNA processing protein RimM [Paramaledivibacter caminithermalis DSM 15212]